MSVSPAVFQRVAVLGLGLLGGSVALAARRAGVARQLVGAGRRSSVLAQALADGVVDEVAEPLTAVHGADLVVLATPVESMPGVLREVVSELSPGALVTDVGSVKGFLAGLLPGLLPSGVTYVGAHPMAGSHLRGASNARADLFDGRRCALTPVPGTDPRVIERIAGFWRALGAAVVVRSPEQHDGEVAWISHLPHLLAFAFAGALEKAPTGAAELAGRGFADFTRIAHSDPALWSEILCTNRKALEGPLDALRASLAELARMLEEGDAESLEVFFQAARGVLAQAEDARSGGEVPEVQAAPQGSGLPQE